MSACDPGAYDDDRPDDLTVAERLRAIADELDPPLPPAKHVFKVRLSHNGVTAHVWTVPEGEIVTITDPIVGALVERGHWFLTISKT